MDYKLALTIAAVLIVVIAALRRRLILEIQAASLLVFRQPRLGTWIYSLIFLPGTLLHELSHWLMAEILQVPTGQFTIIPDLENTHNGEQALGSVKTGRTGPFRTFLIGFAPFITGILALLVLGALLDRVWLSGGVWWQVGLLVYGLVVVSNSMIVSRADSRNWPLMAIIVGLVVFVLYRLGVRLPESWFLTFSSVVNLINQALGLTIGLNLAMILLAYAVRRILERVTKQKIVIGRQHS